MADVWMKSVLFIPRIERSYESDEDPREEEDALGEVRELIKSLSAQLDRWEVERCAEDFPAFEEDALGISTMDDGEDPREEEDALSELMEQVKYLSARLERLESVDNEEDFPFLEADVLGGSFEKDIEDFIAIETLASVPGEPVVSDFKKEAMVEMDGSLFLHEISHDVFTFGVETEEWGIVPFLQVGEALFSPDFDDYLEEEQQNPTSPFADQSSQPMYDSYESDSELDMLDFQEQTAEPCPLFTKENYHEEISHPSPSGDAEQYEEEQSFSMGPVYDHYESDPWESREGEPEEHFSFCPEPVSKQPTPENCQPTLVVHPPVLTRDIQPHVNNCVAEEAACRQFSGVFHWSYEPVKEYMELYFLHNLEPPYFISTSVYKKELKSVTVLLSWLHHLFVIIDKRKELSFRKLLEWLWWKFAFT
jgi:hypothetical protein